MSLWRDVTHWWEFVVENFIDISTPTFYHQSTLEIELINRFKNYNIFLLKNLQNINPNCSIATYAMARVFGKNISQNFSTLFITLINTFLPHFGVLLTVEKYKIMNKHVMPRWTLVQRMASSTHLFPEDPLRLAPQVGGWRGRGNILLATARTRQMNFWKKGAAQTEG